MVMVDLVMVVAVVVVVGVMVMVGLAVDLVMVVLVVVVDVVVIIIIIVTTNCMLFSGALPLVRLHQPPHPGLVSKEPVAISLWGGDVPPLSRFMFAWTFAQLHWGQEVIARSALASYCLPLHLTYWPNIWILLLLSALRKWPTLRLFIATFTKCAVCGIGRIILTPQHWKTSSFCSRALVIVQDSSI